MCVLLRPGPETGPLSLPGLLLVLGELSGGKTCSSLDGLNCKVTLQNDRQRVQGGGVKHWVISATFGQAASLCQTSFGSPVEQARCQPELW